jgi:hypothetical protein
MLLFLMFVLQIEHNIKSEQRDYSDFGDSLNFLTTAVPMFLVSCIYSFGWGIASVVEILRQHSYRGIGALCVVAAAWAALILILRASL